MHRIKVIAERYGDRWLAGLGDKRGQAQRMGSAAIALTWHYMQLTLSLAK